MNTPEGSAPCLSVLAHSGRCGFATALRSPSCWLPAGLGSALVAMTPGIQFRSFSAELYGELVFATVVLIGVLTSLLLAPKLLDPARRFGTSFRRPKQPAAALGIGSSLGVAAFVGLQALALLALTSPFQRTGWLDSAQSGLQGLILGFLAAVACVLCLLGAAERLSRPVVLVIGLALLLVVLDPLRLPSWARVLVFPVSPAHLSADESAHLLPPLRWIAAGAVYDVAIIALWGALASRHGRGPR